MLLTTIVFIVILGLLIFVHELGHFLMARKNGVKVEEFAFGFPPRLWSIKRKETVYAINAIPLGGYVKLLGEEEGSDQAGSFGKKSVWSRISIVIAGVIMNFILAIILMTIGFSVGMTPLVSDPAKMSGTKESKVMVVYVLPNSAASSVGIKVNDIMNGFSSASDLQTFTRANVGKEVNISVTRKNAVENLTVKLSDNTGSPLGVSIVPVTKVKQPVHIAFVSAVVETGKTIGSFFGFIGNIIKSVFTTGSAGAAAEGVVGPIGLFNYTSESIKLGWIYVLQLVILLSINLGIVNILPFPALDGGKALFIGLEGIFRKKVVKAEIENIIHLVGFVLLILLMIAITFRDVKNFF